MRPRVVSIIGSTAFAAHETWLTERLELDLGLDQKEARYYARFVLSSLIQPEKEIDSHREKELFVYNKPRYVLYQKTKNLQNPKNPKKP